MKSNNNFESIDAAPTAHESRLRLVRVLKDAATELRSNPNDYAAIAYGIAGFFATDFVRQLSSDDPIDEILTIAGELEIKPTDAKELQQELLQKIDLLE